MRKLWWALTGFALVQYLMGMTVHDAYFVSAFYTELLALIVLALGRHQ